MIKTPDQLTNESVITGQVPPHMKDRYTVRVKDATAKNSKSKAGNFMMDWECEIVKPLVKVFGGQKYALDSLEFHYYVMLKVFNDDGSVNMEKTDRALRLIIGGHPGDKNCLHAKLGFANSIDDENPDVSVYKGLVFDAIVGSRERIAQKPDPEKPGAYVAITDSNGAPISQGWEIVARIEDIQGLSKEVLEASPAY